MRGISNPLLDKLAPGNSFRARVRRAALNRIVTMLRDEGIHEVSAWERWIEQHPNDPDVIIFNEPEPMFEAKPCFLESYRPGRIGCIERQKERQKRVKQATMHVKLEAKHRLQQRFPEKTNAELLAWVEKNPNDPDARAIAWGFYRTPITRI